MRGRPSPGERASWASTPCSWWGWVWFAPGYIDQFWNLPALRGVLVYGIPLEELLFGAVFGLYWCGVYEHVTWSEIVAHAERGVGS
jgi:hypothetical protein